MLWLNISSLVGFGLLKNTLLARSGTLKPVYTIRNVCRPSSVQLSWLSAAGQFDFKRQESFLMPLFGGLTFPGCQNLSTVSHYSVFFPPKMSCYVLHI